MQTWNQCPIPTSTVATPMAAAPTGYAAPNTNPMTYMQYPNQPIPSGYTAEQWAAAQQQNWASYQQWQQQYQQWQAQYGEKYQESIMKQYGQQAPPLPVTSQPPPPPPKDEKPPLPPASTVSSYGYSTALPPPPNGSNGGVKRPSISEIESDSAKKMKESNDEPSEAEKLFDAQFKQCEEQFNAWKLQNANHPDRDKYNQYVAQYTSWREKQIKRRELKRLKREQQKLAAAAKGDSEKKGIGTSLNAMSKQEQMAPASQVGPALPMQQPTLTATPQLSMTPMMQPADMTQAWAQWGQYTQPMATPMTPYMPPPMSMATMATPAQPNFSQPPPGFPPVNLSQPPPGFTQPQPSVNSNALPPPLSQPSVNTKLQPQQGPNYSQSNFNQPQNQQRAPRYSDNNQNQKRFNAAPPVNFNSQGGNFNNAGKRNNDFNPANMSGNQGNVGNSQETMDSHQGNKNNLNEGNDSQNRSDGSSKNRNFRNDNNKNDNFGNNNKFGNKPSTKSQEFNQNDLDFDSRGPQDMKNDSPNIGNRDPNNFNNGPNLKNRGPNNLGKDGPNFRNRGPNDFSNDGPNFGNKGPNNFSNDGPNFGNKGPNNFRQDGPNFGNRGPNDFEHGGPNFGNRGPDNFGNRGPNDFEHGGPNFGNRGPDNFGNRGPDNFGNRGPNDFEHGGPNFGNRGSDNFGNRGPNNFNNDGPNDFRNRGPNNFNNREQNNFGNDGPTNVRNQGPNNFGNNGVNNFGNRGPNNFGNRDFNNFDNDDANVGNRGDFDNVEPTFKNRDRNDFHHQGPNHFGIEDPRNLPNAMSNNAGNKGPNAFENNSPLEFNKGPNSKNKKGKNKNKIDSTIKEFSESLNDPVGMKGSNQSDFGMQSSQFELNFNPISNKICQDQDSNPDTQVTEKILPAEDEQALNANPEPSKQLNAAIVPTLEEPPTLSFSDDINLDGANDFIRPSFTEQRPLIADEPPINKSNFPSFDSENFNNALPLSGPREAQNQPPLAPPPTQKAIPSLLDLKIVPPPNMKIPPKSQLNCNDEDIPKSKNEFTAPAKVIDYAHSKRPIVTEFVEPIFVFDYKHGESHLNVPNLSADFKNWEENEENLSEYYEEMMRKLEAITPVTDTISAGEKSSSPDNKEEEKKNKSQNLKNIAPKISDLTTVRLSYDDILCSSSKLTEPLKIAIILRGPPGSGKSLIANLIKDKEVIQRSSTPRILSIDDYFLVKRDSASGHDKTEEMEYIYIEAMEPECSNHLVKTFKKDVTDGIFNFIILDNINEKIADYEEMWSLAKTNGFKVYVCEMETDVQICLKRNIHNRSEAEINRIIDYFEPTPSHHEKLDVTALLEEQTIEDFKSEDEQEVLKDDSEEKEDKSTNDDTEGSQVHTKEDKKWEKMEGEDKLDRLDGLKRKHENKPRSMEDFLQVPDNYNVNDSSGKKRIRWTDLEKQNQQETTQAVESDVSHTHENLAMDSTNEDNTLTSTKYISPRPRFQSKFNKKRLNKR
ncbi:hypothetical protein TSAR_010354 [Trichomalopsis sarcophagae]|uniref:YLP motif-containing protein 1 n=1 Tax=Trichomalopsis sarcophagae TaxID=543379 RepID=A0A232F959_9HYME|nr:hypothetical protein TSAR_010354 [Trichomalopsis sarcophagae]